ncbi:MAG: ABC transporter permease subunit [Defluviitaleaceae bacterium]|nr:ABC transporter permease subunit [Defluviitaleaceae bacterium]
MNTDNPKSNVMHEEQVQTPFMTAMKMFFKRKMTIIGLIGFFGMFLASVIIPFFFPVDVRDFDMAQFNQPPSRSMMRVSREIRGDVALLAAGAGFGVGVGNDNSLHTWGVMSHHSEPLQNPPQPEGRIVQISAGQGHAAALTEDGYVYIWGDENVVFRLADVPSGIQGRTIQVQAARRFSLALTDDGRLHTWGNMPDLRHVSPGRLPAGRVGVQIEVNTMSGGVLTECGYVFILISEGREWRDVPEHIQGRITDFTLTDHNGLAILDDYTVYIWGATGLINEIPEHIQGQAVAIDSGTNHATVLLRDGSVVSWGEDRHGRTAYPTRVSDGVMIAVGWDHNYVLQADGSVTTWGMRGFIFGTDGMGRCIFSRLWLAGRYTLMIGAISSIVAFLIGVLLGGFGGYFGGALDMFIMRFAEVVGSIPFLPIALILQFRFRDNFGQIGGMVLLMFVLGILSWPGLMRIVRGLILQARESEYVTAAKALGAREFSIIFRHILPNILSPVIVWLTLNLAGAMLIETGLSFIGFGVQEPTPTWGNMLNAANDSVVLRAQWWRWVFPAVALVSVALSINLVGDGLREATDPKTQGR